MHPLDQPIEGPNHGGKTLRETALAAIDATEFYPEQGRNRIRSMVETRPDWLISRQRAWGAPLAMFVDKKSGKILQDEAVNERIVAAMKKGGADVWWSTPASDFLGNAYNADDYEKVEDILDVWFDSGCTHAFVLEKRGTLPFPADVYLEGSDQHRGWFHSSLLESCATRGRAPYESVITYGFIVADDGMKMSKSRGNGVDPQTVEEQFGIEIFRLCVAAADYRDELRLSKTIFDQSAEAYRKLRNTLRYLLGALADFTDEESLFGPPASSRQSSTGGASRLEAGGPQDMPLLERWLLHRLRELDETVRSAYGTYEFRRALSAIVEFCNVDLSAFYVDVRKDALYCDRPDSVRRRACRTALSEVFDRLTAWLAPIMPFTMEEAWLTRFPNDVSVHLRQFPETPKAWKADAIAAEMAHLRKVRATVTGALEIERREKRIGASLEAAPRVFIADPVLLGPAKTNDMAELCITSGITIEAGRGPEGSFHLAEVPGVWVIPEKARGKKCARSWRILPEVGHDPRYPDLSLRDADAVEALKHWLALQPPPNDPNIVLDRILEPLNRLIQYDRAYIMLPNAGVTDGSRMTVAASQGTQAPVRGQEILLYDESPARTVTLSALPMVVPDLQALVTQGRISRGDGAITRSWLGVPIRAATDETSTAAPGS